MTVEEIKAELENHGFDVGMPPLEAQGGLYFPITHREFPAVKMMFETAVGPAKEALLRSLFKAASQGFEVYAKRA